MKGEQLAEIRNRLDLSRVELARALGYVGNENTVYQQIRQYENGKREIPPSVARLAIMFDRFGIPDDF